MELKLNIGTYCDLLWSILGDHCNYYKELLKLIIASLTTKSVLPSVRHIRQRFACGSHGQLLMIVAPSFTEIGWRRTLRPARPTTLNIFP
jgi:hypothetical protein